MLYGRVMPRAFITGLSGLVITAEERAFLRETDPWGFILFARNVQNPRQVADLVADFRATVARSDAPVLIDQEGGRVQRLGPPHWPVYPNGRAYNAVYIADKATGQAATSLGTRLIGDDLLTLGITVDCLPVADIPVAGADSVIGDRAYGDTPETVIALAGAAAEGLMEAGVLPVLKHIPGHGRAAADSHKALPVVDADRDTLERTDFAAFRALAYLPMAMTAHVVFTAFDPRLPATTSRTMIDRVIRGFIGFNGLLMSDDVSMEALTGTLGDRTAAALAAGCDVALHCNGRMDEMRQVAANAPELSGQARDRAEKALAARRPPKPFDVARARAVFAQQMAQAVAPQVSRA
jgi:beta-N-acetylhexosaminidase